MFAAWLHRSRPAQKHFMICALVDEVKRLKHRTEPSQLRCQKQQLFVFNVGEFVCLIWKWRLLEPARRCYLATAITYCVCLLDFRTEMLKGASSSFGVKACRVIGKEFVCERFDKNADRNWISFFLRRFLWKLWNYFVSVMKVYYTNDTHNIEMTIAGLLLLLI